MKRTTILIAIILPLLSFSIPEEDNFIARLMNGFKEYREKYLPVKLFLNFDQPTYAPGDTAFFRTLYVNADGHTVVKGRQIVHVLLVNEKGDVINHQKTEVRNGVGSYYLVIPFTEKPENYRVVAFTNWMRNFGDGYFYEKNVIVKNNQLPKAPQTATSNSKILVAAGETPEQISVSISGLTPSESYYLVVSNYRAINHVAPLQKNENGDAVVSLQKKMVVEGALVSVLTKDGKLFDEVYYAPLIEKYNISFSKTKDLYTTREKSVVKITVEDNNNRPVRGKVAIRVINESLFPNEDLAYNFFSPESEERYRHWVDWEKVLAKNKSPEYPIEDYLRLTGKVFFDDGKKVPDSTLLMFFFPNRTAGYHHYIRGQEFSFPLVYDFYGTEDVFYAASHRKKDLPNLRVKLNDEFNPRLEPVVANGNGGGESPYLNFAKQRRLIDKSYTFYQQPVSKEETDPNFFIEDELGGADITLNLKDFVLFPTMAEVVRELLRAVEYRKYGNKEYMRVYTLYRTPVNGAGPLFVIDGVLTKDLRKFINLNPSDVIYIKVIRDENKLIRLGPLLDNGVLLVKTRSSAAKLKADREDTLVIEGFAPKADPVTEKEIPSNVPDLRSRLYWNSTLELNELGEAIIEFNTSDDLGKFRIQVDGLSQAGQFFKGEDTFTVQFSHPK